MDKIICLVGESGSGKSTIAEKLEEHGYNYIQSYTTREPRYNGEKGHIFVDINEYYRVDDGKESKDNIIAYTYFNNNHYWSTKEQYRAKGISIYIVDPIGVYELRQKIADAEIEVIYLKTEKQIRIDRMCLRKHNKINVCDEDILDRIEHDKKVFTVIQCNYVVDGNRSKEEVLKDIVNIIDNNKK